MPRHFPLTLLAALFGLTACWDPPQGDSTVYKALESRFEAHGGGLMVRRTAPTGEYDFSIFRVHGMEACKAVYDDRIRSVSHQIVFGALFGEDLSGQDYLARDYNLSLWSKDLTQDLWNGYCWQMVKNRDDFADCPSEEDQTFMIGLFSKRYYETEENYDTVYDAAMGLIEVDYNGARPAGASCTS